MILFDEKTGIFHLRNAYQSYVFQLVRGRYLLHRYWGRPLREFRDSYPLQPVDRAFSPQPNAYENERTFSLDVLPREYPALRLRFAIRCLRIVPFSRAVLCLKI